LAIESRPMPALPRRTEIPRLLRHPLSFARAYWPSLALLLAGATADAITTYHNLRLYGPDVEAHVVQRWVSEAVGVAAGVPIAKLIQLGFVLLVAAWWKPWTPWLLALCGVLYGAAAVSNYYLLL
jgi:CHASE2 domain-containing sensor protein